MRRLQLQNIMKTVLEPLAEVGHEENSVGVGTVADTHQSPGPLFVVGMWRSGTSLFYALLNQHPQIALMYEGDLLALRPVFWLPGAKSRWMARWQFWNQALTRHNIDLDRLALSSSSFQESIEKAYRATALRKGATIWGEKSPNYYDSLLRLGREFPQARFIVIWRDPSATCRSVIRAGEDPSSWFNRRGMIIRTLIGYSVMKAQCDRLISQGAPVHQVQYEALVKDPTDTMKGVCAFLDVPFVSRMASLEAADRSAIYPGEHHSLVKGEAIVSPQRRSEILSVGVKKKIGRYVALWRARTDGQWPLFPAIEYYKATKPTWLERVLDRCVYTWLRGLDCTINIVYSFAPMPLLSAWRELRHRTIEKSR